MKRFIGSKKPGNILSAFKANGNDILPEKFKKIKNNLVQRCGRESLQASWKRLTETFDKEIQFIKEKGPQIDFSTILKNDVKFPSNFADEIRKRGCVVIRNVVDRKQALKYKESVQQYINNHKGKIAGPGNIFFVNSTNHQLISIDYLIHRRESSGLGDLLVKSKMNE